ncbi:hypothetical protein [Yinghuangia seranimata]|uniref:hypothetical protein n=1 Tax=Yinghuangia seranimata TaxID=408067 RepID=UPI00248C8B4C|nr:hypothetical protein [Yinghuangia seranimata]MDI2128198.1 hypothetical protein [Yinghuangia seranimata]
MDEMERIHRALNPSLYANGAAEASPSRLLSATAPGGAGAVKVTPDQLDTAAKAVDSTAESLKRNTNGSRDQITAAAKGIDGWETARALGYLGETWEHQVDSLFKALMQGFSNLEQVARNYRQAEERVKKQIKQAGG